MSHDPSHHVVPYKTYGIILALLLVMTAISVAVTHIDLGAWGVFTALFLASIKSTLVLVYFMHLKFDSPFMRIMVAAIFLVVGIVVFITLLDYLFR
ncbi:MAG: cytochrome C oxidase subunit IV family protein [Breznakibacter sp.]